MIRAEDTTPASPSQVPEHSSAETLTVSRIFKKSVGRVVAEKRMWASLWSELDKAEETDLMNQFKGKQELLENMEPIVSLSGSGSRRSSKLGVEDDTTALKASAVPVTRAPRKILTEAEKSRRRQSYVRKATELCVEKADLFNPEEYPNVPPSFLWEASSTQNQVRKLIANHPVTGKTSTDFEIADVEPLNDESPITGPWIVSLIEELKLERIIPYTVAYQIVRRAIRSCLPLDNIVRVSLGTTNATAAEEIAIIGDLHGQLDDLLMIFREAGTPWEGRRLLFNGDFVDRGEYSCEVALVLLACRAAFPELVFLNRGNHEAEDMNSLDGFMAEAIRKYDEPMWKLINSAFAALPVGHLITLPSQRVFVVHAGLSFSNFTIEQANQENRFLPYFRRNSLIQDLLWSDPYEGYGRVHSKRGAGCQFGADVAEQFFKLNRVSLIIRSHECEDHGYKLWFENRLYTIFSASNYCGDSDNYGAYCILSSASKVPQIRLFIARKQVLRFSERQQRARQATIAKLLVRLVSKIDDVENTLRDFAMRDVINVKLASGDSSTSILTSLSSVGFYETISMTGWCAALEVALGIRVPFRRFASRLGIVSLTGCGDRIHIGKWCARFRHKARPGESKLAHRVSTLLYSPSSPFRAALEELFQHFDVNKDGSITPEEFKQGVTSLLLSSSASSSSASGVSASSKTSSKMQVSARGGSSRHTDDSNDDDLDDLMWTEEEMEELVKKADANEDGEIDYNEFFAVFAFGDVELEAVEEDIEYL